MRWILRGNVGVASQPGRPNVMARKASVLFLTLLHLQRNLQKLLKKLPIFSHLQADIQSPNLDSFRPPPPPGAETLLIWSLDITKNSSQTAFAMTGRLLPIHLLVALLCFFISSKMERTSCAGTLCGAELFPAEQAPQATATKNMHQQSKTVLSLVQKH